MTDYVQFSVEDNNHILIEVNEGENAFSQGVQKAGLREIATKQIEEVGTNLQEALRRAIMALEI